MKIRTLIAIAALALLLSGCMKATYLKPSHIGQKNQYSLIVEKNYDQLWKELISYSASTFFSIDN
jgi:hypothetical protein